mmetsp:Transcript_8641/g.35548  ORF Transcript_8641/g.35548 Transcript_8641/m.35548 type:complete len:1034 (+) Transcript_8641:3-3104(+)
MPIDSRKSESQPITTMATSARCGPPVHQADFCRRDSAVVCVTGNGILNFFRATDNHFKSIQSNLKRDVQNYLCHCWLREDSVVVASDCGDLLLFENYELKSVLLPNATCTGTVTSIAEFSKGFICGGSAGLLYIFEHERDSRDPYRCTHLHNIQNDGSPVVGMAVSPSEEMLICATSKNQMYSLTLSCADMSNDDVTHVRALSTSFHSPGPSGSLRIVALDVCLWKPLLATCGEDQSLRIWNFEERMVELVRDFSDDLVSVSFHPSGLFVLVGSRDKLHLLSVLMHDASIMKEIHVHSCGVCRFAHGGHIFAVVNSHVVRVYSAYTCQPCVNLRGHNGHVQAMQWAKSDRRIATMSFDGAIVIWKLHDGAKECEYVIARVSFVSGIANEDLSHIFVVCDDHCLRELSVVSGSIELATTYNCGLPLSCLALAETHQVIFYGTSEARKPNCIHAAHLPTWATTNAAKYHSHASEVTCMSLTRDNSLLFTGGADGSLCIFASHDFNSSAERPNDMRIDTIGVLKEFTEEILVTRADMERQNAEIMHLRSKVDELVLNNEYQLRLRDMKYRDNVAVVADQFSFELQSDAQRYQQLKDDKRMVAVAYEDRLRSVEADHELACKRSQDQYNGKLDTEVNRCTMLRKERRQRTQAWESAKQTIIDGQSQRELTVVSEFEAQIEEEHRRQGRLVADKESILCSLSKATIMVEHDADSEVGEIKQRYVVKLSAERHLTKRLEADNELMKKRFSVLTKDVDDQRDEICSLQDKERELLNSIQDLEKDIEGHKKEIREREETIADKEKRIYDLKKKNQELEKFRFVLDYKIKELKRQIEPREIEIFDMRQQVEEMDLELGQYHKSNVALDLMIGELRLRLNGMNLELHNAKARLSVIQVRCRQLLRAVDHPALRALGHKELKRHVRTLVHIMKNEHCEAPETADSSFEVNYRKQREHLERCITALRRKISRDMQLHINDHARLVEESTVLVHEVCCLRRENHRLRLKQSKVSSLDSQRHILSESRSQSIILKSRVYQLEQLLGI